MRKLVISGAVLSFLLLARVANAATADVADLAQLNAAIADSAVATINITENIQTPAMIVISRPVAIIGNSKALTFTGDTSGWQSHNVLQVYHATGVTISDLSISGGDAGLLVNGSEVTLHGTVNVSGNEFGGIESSGVGAVLDITDVTLVDASESFGKPVVWEDGTSGTTVVGNSVLTRITKGVQFQYYLNSSNTSTTSIVSSEAELRSALADSLVSTIEFGGDISSIASQVTVNRPVTIDGKGHTLSAFFPKVDNSNNSAIGVQSNNVNIKNLIVDGTGGLPWPQQIHGINVYRSSGVTLDSITARNFMGSGIVVNASVVTATNVTTENNAWNGINVDKGTVTLPATLTINGVSHHSENTASNPAIWVDNNSNDYVSVVDVRGQYSLSLFTKDGTEGRAYTLVTGNPVITLNGDATMTVAFGSNFTDPGATAVDSRGNTVDVTVTGSVDTRNPGDYTLTYSATDSLDNSAQLTRTVTVSAPPARSSSGRRGGGGGGTTVSLPAQASPVAVAATGEVLGAFTDAETQAQIVVVKQQIAGLIQQLIAMLQAQLAAAIAAQ